MGRRKQQIRLPWQLTRDMFLSEEEVGALLAHLRAQCRAKPLNPGPRTDELIICGLAFSGLRNSEFCSLRIRDTIVGSGTSTFAVAGTARQDRTVHVPASLSRLVQSYVDEVRPKVVAPGTDHADTNQPLVLNDRGRPYDRTGLYRRVVRILKAAGFASRASVQLLRHTYGYLGYKRSGGNLLFLQRQMGHAHPMVTSIYSEFVDEDYGRLANLVAGEMVVSGKAIDSQRR